MTSARPWLQTRLDSLLNTTGQEVGFYNSATGMGTSRDKTSYTTYGTYQTLDTQTLAGLYHGHDLSARVVDVIPDEELRLPFRVEVELDDEDGEADEDSESSKKEAKRLAKLIKKEFKRLNVREHLLLGRKWGRCFGGAATILGAQDGRAARQPLDPRQVRQIDWLRTIDRRYLWPNTYYTSGAKNGQPETYYLNDHHPGGSESFVIHESRLILWPGATTAQQEKDLNRSWDHSVLDRLWGVLKSFETLYKGVELLITEGPQAVYKVRDLIEQITAGQEQAVMTRLEVIETMRSIFRAVVIDANGGEDFQRQQVTYSGTPEILGQIQLRLSAATQIPMIILFGQAPGGLGVTGENDLRWFFDRTASSQLNVLGPRIEQLADLVLQVAGYDSAVGQCEVKFQKLWTPTAKEEAEARFITSQTDTQYVTSGVISPEEVGLSRFGECGEWHPDWKAYDRAARIKVLKDVLANLEAGSEPGAPGTSPESDQQQENQTQVAVPTRTDFDPDQERDSDGRWTSTGIVDKQTGEHYVTQARTIYRSSAASRAKIAASRELETYRLANKPEQFRKVSAVKHDTADKARAILDQAAQTIPGWDHESESRTIRLVENRVVPNATDDEHEIAASIKSEFRAAAEILTKKVWHKTDLGSKIINDLLYTEWDPEFNGGILLSQRTRRDSTDPTSKNPGSQTTEGQE